jgi:hypothetical protein
MATSIERKLSEELLVNIVSLTARDLLPKICLVSKTFNRLATPYLYSTITLDDSSNNSDSLTLVRLAYTIFASPDYAPLVKSIVIHGWHPVEEEDGPGTITKWSTCGVEEAEEVLRRKCVAIAISDQEADNLYNKIKSGRNEDAILALLLANLPNLRKMDINFGMLEEHADFIALFELIANRIESSSTTDKRPIPYFPVPIDIMVKGTDDRYPNDTAHLALFFNISNLHSIYGWKMGDQANELQGDGDNPFAKLRPRSCLVEYIELRTSKLHKRNLQFLLDATIPGKLKTFNYEIGCTWAWCNVEHAAIMRSLEKHHNSLESLGLSHEEFYPYQFGNDDEKPYPVSFRPFRALKRLKIAPVYVWGHEGFNDEEKLKEPGTKKMLYEALPESLEELWITRAESQATNNDDAAVQFVLNCLLPALEIVVQEKSQFQSFPRLSQLRIEFPLVDWKDEWFDSLSSFCRKAGANDIKIMVILAGLPAHSLHDSAYERPWGWNEDIHWEACEQNDETPKKWIVATEEQDLGQTLKESKAKLVKEGEA